MAGNLQTDMKQDGYVKGVTFSNYFYIINKNWTVLKKAYSMYFSRHTNCTSDIPLNMHFTILTSS